MIHSDIIRQEVYALDCYRLKSCFFERTPKFFVDIGANVGWFSKLAADNFIDCQIFSYELDIENYQNATNLLNQYKNVKLFNTAVIGKHRFNKYWKHSSNIGGHKPIFQGSESYISEDSISSKMMSTLNERGKFIETEVKQSTIQDIIEQNNIDYIDFLKLDCEGSEYEILNYAMDHGLCYKILNLSAEMHGRTHENYKIFLERIKENFEIVNVKDNILFANNNI